MNRHPNMFIGNTFKGPARLAFVFSYTSHAIVANNTFIDMGGGEDDWVPAFVVHHSHDNLFLNNVISSSKTGMLLNASPNNILKGNKVEDSGYGLALCYSSDGNVIENNTFSQNLVNIMLDDAHENTITGNNFISQKRQSAYDNSDDNTWGQNYWSDYSGPDEDGDQISDMPYSIAPRGADPLPLIDACQITPETVPRLTEVPYSEPQWGQITITEDTVWEEQSITQTQTIVIVEGATLTLNDVTLTFAYDSQEQIVVMPGAALHIERSILRSDGADHHSSIWVHKGAKLIMKDSELRNAGNWYGSPGLALEGDGAIIENCVICGGFLGISIRGSSGHRITDNTISECFRGIEIFPYSTGNLIANNTISKCIEYAIMPRRAPGNTVVDNDISDCGLLIELLQGKRAD